VFRPGTLTAAHRTLPFGTRVRVTNLYNGRSAVVRINDRGPFHGSRVIDLAHGAAGHLGLISSGVADVKLEVLPSGN
jgi:rare lipoprotein A